MAIACDGRKEFPFVGRVGLGDVGVERGFLFRFDGEVDDRWIGG